MWQIAAARGRAFAIVFLAASVVPVHFVWLIPELFNFSVVLYAFFLWSYKEVAADPRRHGGAASCAAAAPTTPPRC